MPEGASSRGSVLLTGATGFIGRRLQTKLFDAGFAVRALVRHDSPRAERLDARVEQVSGDLADGQALARGLAGTKAVINCAGEVRGFGPEDFAAANVDGVRALAAAMSRLSAPPALLHISSLAAREPGLSDYAASKRAGEQVLEEYPDLLWTILRPPAVYGPGDEEMRRALKLVRRGLVIVPGGHKDQRISVLHVDDLGAAALAWLAAPARFRQYTYEIDDGHPRGYDWRELAEAVCARPLLKRPLFVPVPAGLLRFAGSVNEQLCRMARRKPILSTGKARELTHDSWLCDNAPFANTSGWQPQIGLAQGAAALFSK